MKRKWIAGMLALSLTIGNVMPVSAVEEVKQETVTEVSEESEEETVTEEKEEVKKEETQKEETQSETDGQSEENKSAKLKSAEVKAGSDIVNVADNILKDYLVNYHDEDGDGELSKEEMSKITEVYISDYDGTGEVPINILTLEWAVNLESITIEGYHPIGLDILDDLKKLEHLQFINAKLEDLAFLNRVTGLQYLGLWDNQITDISVIGKLTNLKDVTLSRNGITDFSPLTSLENLVYVNLTDNPITDISPIKQWNKMPSLHLSGNEQVSKAKLFELFVDFDISLIAGNRLGLVLPLEVERTYIDNKSFSVRDIEWNVQDESVAKKTENGALLGVSGGTTSITMSIDGVTKTFPVKVAGEREPQVAGEESVALQKLKGDACAVLDSEKTLWSINADKTEKVKTGTEKYIANLVYGKKKNTCWGQYYILDSKDTLWNADKASYEDEYTTEKLFDDVAEFGDKFALLKNGDLYDIHTKVKKAERVEKYFINYTGDGNVLNPNILTKEKEFKNIETGQVYEAGVENVEKNGSSYVVLKNGTLSFYDTDSQDNVVKLTGFASNAKELLDDSFYMANDGSIWSWEVEWDVNGRYPVTKKVSEEKWLYADYEYMLTMSHELKRLNYETNQYETIMENIKEVCGENGYGVQVLDQENNLLSIDWQNVSSKVAEDVAHAEGDYFQKMDGSFWEFRGESEHNHIIDNVVSFSTSADVGGGAYITRADGSVWKYNISKNNGKPYMVKEPTVMKGDLSGEGQIDIDDVQVLFTSASRRKDLTEAQKKVADVNGDGVIDITDVQRLFQYASKRIDTL